MYVSTTLIGKLSSHVSHSLSLFPLRLYVHSAVSQWKKCIHADKLPAPIIDITYVCRHSQYCAELAFWDIWTHFRHFKGKGFVLLQNSNLAIFKRFPGEALLCLIPIIPFTPIVPAFHSIPQMGTGIGTATRWWCWLSGETCLPRLLLPSSIMFGVQWETQST